VEHHHLTRTLESELSSWSVISLSSHTRHDSCIYLASLCSDLIYTCASIVAGLRFAAGSEFTVGGHKRSLAV
jgi:hypothetical protein